MRLQTAANSTAAFTTIEAEVAGVVLALFGFVLDDAMLLTLLAGRIAASRRSLRGGLALRGGGGGGGAGAPA